MPPEDFFKLPPRTMTALAVAIGFLLAETLSSDEQSSLGNFLMLIAQMVETNSAQAQLLQDTEQPEATKSSDKQCDDVTKNTM